MNTFTSVWTESQVAKKSIFDKIASKTGGRKLSETESVRNWIDSGVLSLNQACSGRYMGGGMPSGKVIEIYGPSSTCKTLFATNVLYGTQKADGWACFIDAENSLDKTFAEKASHLDTDKVLIYDDGIDTLEKGFAKIHEAIREIREEDKDRPIMIVYDSIAASPSEREFQDTALAEKQVENKDMPGERAKICSKELRKLTPVLARLNASVLFINQVRNKIGVMYGNPETTAGGGKSLEFYASLRLRTNASKKYKDKLGNVIGMEVSVRNVKNKCFQPFVECTGLELFYNKGINPLGGLRDSLMRAERVVKIEGKKGRWAVAEPYAGGRKVEFVSAVEGGNIPVEILLDCPTLIDAESSDQVSSYLETFKSAMDAAQRDVAQAEEVSEEGSGEE